MKQALREQLNTRVRDMRARMKDAGLDALVVEGRSNTLYLTGFSGTASVTLLTRRGAWFLTDSRYIERARRDLAPLYKVELAEGPLFETLAGLLKKRAVHTIGFEGAIAYERYLQLRKAARPARLRRAAVFAQARMAKSDYEARLLRRAQQAAEAILDTLLGEIGPGMSEREVRNRLLALVNERGLEGVSFPPIIASGPNSSMPHAECTDRRIKRRDIVTIDMGVRLDGYCSDMTRTVFFGKPTARMRQVYDTVLEAQARALEAIEPGARGRDIDARAREHIADNAYGEYFGHGTGHGLGIDIHEAPRLSPRSRDRLSAGMCVSVEPGIYLPGAFGVRIEDVVVVRPGGCENLMHFDKSPIVL